MPEKKVAKQSASSAMKERVADLEARNVELEEQLAWYKKQAKKWKGLRR